MRKIILALTITLVLSLAIGGGLAFAANAAAPAELSAALSVLEEVINPGELQPNSFSAVASDSFAANGSISQNDQGKGNGTTDEDPAEDEGDDVGGPDNGAYCRGDKEKNHPAGEKIAGEFFDEAGSEEGYTEIMGWFCGSNEAGLGHFGFGEIRLGYRIAEATGIPLDEIFKKRADGMGWGNILKELGLDKKPDKPTKPANAGGNNGQGISNNGQGNSQGNGLSNGQSNGNNGKANGHTKAKGNKGKKP